MAESRIVIHDDHFPLLYVQYIGNFSNNDWAGMIASLVPRLDRGVPFGWINDARTDYLPDSSQRDALSAFYAERDEDVRALVMGVATLSTNPLVRGVVTAMSWVAPLPFPHKMFAAHVDADAFVRVRLGLEASAPGTTTYAESNEIQSRNDP